jgi:hypothetical protein
VHFLRSLLLVSLLVALASCATAFRDDSHYVAVSPTDGYYLLEKGGALALQLGYPDPPISSNDDRIHSGSYVDVVAFRFDRAGVLSAPPGYFAAFTPDSTALELMARLKQGASTWPEILKLFGGPNRLIKQPDGGMLVYHEIPKSS